MHHRSDYTARYLEVIENLHGKNPKEKELVKSLFEGSLKINKFDKAAKMTSKLLNNFQEPSYALI